MPDTTQMKAILKGFPNVNVDSKNLDMNKDNIKGHLKILHLIAIPSVQFMIKCNQIDQDV